MKKRSTDILQKLMKHPARDYSIPGLAKDFGVSQRTLRNDVNEINSFLKSIGEESIIIGQDGTIKTKPGCNPTMILEKLFQMDTYNYRLSSEERRIYLLSSLLCSKKYISMQDIADELYVSRVSILNDVQALQHILSDMDIYLMSDTGKGMKLICSLEQRIELMMLIYRKTAASVENEGFFQNFIFKKMEIRFPFSEIFDYLQEYISSNNIIFIDDVLYDIVIYLFAMFNVVDKTDKKKLSAVLSRDEKLDGLDYFLIYLGYMLDIDITDHMLHYYRTYLRGHDLHSYVKSIDEMELYKIIHYFLSEIDQSMNLHLTLDSLLIDSLLLHIKNMKKWGGFEVELPKADNIAVDYDLLKENIEKHSHILERFLGYKLSENMKRSIVIHICVALIRNQRDMSRLSVVIVCPGSMATGKYLESQIKNYFDFHIVGVISANQVFRRLREQKEQVDFILSTVPIYSEQFQVVTVHPFLTMDDLNQIQEVSFLCQRKKDARPLYSGDQRVLGKMKNLIADREMSYNLKKEMENLISSYETNYNEIKFSAIGELLKKEHITITYEELEWREAMRLSVKALVDHGYVGPDYIEISIQNVEKYGDYIIIGKGIALAHANSENGVHKDGLSLLVCPTGITFSDGETVVYMIFCFSSTGEKEYLEMMKEMVELSLDEDAFQDMLSMTVDELFEVLN